MITKSEAKIQLDGIWHLGVTLHQAHRIHGNIPLILFKSDVTHAYQLIPMHLLWQIKQIVTIDGLQHID